MKNLEIKKLFLVTSYFCSLFFAQSFSFAEPEFRLNPYIVVGESRGHMRTSGVDSDFSQGFGNALQKANGALGLDFDVRGEENNLLSQVWYTSLSDTKPSVEGVNNFSSAAQNYTSLMITETLGFSLLKEEGNTIDLNFGARLASLTNELLFRQATETRITQDKLLIDPVIGLNTSFLLDESYILRFGGDYGGFGVTSDSTWQAYGALDLALSKKAFFSFGYRAMSYTYDKGSFKYDNVIKGPMLGFDFKF